MQQRGQIDPTKASGRAILAVQQASQQPLTEQLYNLKETLEHLARVFIEMIIIHNSKGLEVEVEEKNPETGETYMVKDFVNGITLQKLNATGKIDITPHSPIDKFVAEQTLENFYNAGAITLEEFVNALDDDSAYPKKKLKEIVKKQEEERLKIAELEQKNQLMIQEVQQYLNSDPETQALTNMQVANMQQQ